MAHGWEEIEEHVSAWDRENPEPRFKFFADRKTRAYVLPLDMLPYPGSVVASVAYWTSDEECLPYIVYHTSSYSRRPGFAGESAGSFG